MTVDEAAFDDEGWLVGVHRIPSPHCDARPGGIPVRLIVIHAISLPPGEFGGDAIERLFAGTLDPDAHPYFGEIRHLRVSAHFLIRRGGQLLQFVSCDQRAWHAGTSSWQGIENCNDFSIGIELEGCDDQPFAEAQYSTLERIVRAIRQSYPIEEVLGHADISPGRKTDPGPHFDWALFRRQLAA
jgi:AmpD protein